MIDTLTGRTVTAKLWAKADEIEPQAKTQLLNIASLPWVAHVAVMPDVHYGKGATVGSVIAMREAVSPAAVGVDIGCGMLACKTSLYGGDFGGRALASLRQTIETLVPVGFNSHTVDHLANGIKQHDPTLYWQIIQHMQGFSRLDPHVWNLTSRVLAQCGTLGGGNHFIEICISDRQCPVCRGGGFLQSGTQCGNCVGGRVGDGNIWIMLHSGSRNIGKELAEIHIAKARTLAHNAELPDPDLAVFLAQTPEMTAYRHDLYWAQEYARLNRLVMLDLIKQAIGSHFDHRSRITFDEPITCHHNYLAEETHFGENLFVTRKGAISAARSQYGIIPGSMGTASFIVRGLGNAESMCSASHGAGRRMSRGAAKRTFTVADLEQQTAGVECRKDEGVLDEIPGAYKDINSVMAAQRDLVEIVTELKQILCIKG